MNTDTRHCIPTGGANLAAAAAVHPRAPRVAPTCSSRRNTTQRGQPPPCPLHRIAPDGTPRKQQRLSVCARRARARRRALVPSKRENALRNHPSTTRTPRKAYPRSIARFGSAGQESRVCPQPDGARPKTHIAHTLRTHRRPQQVRNGVRPDRARTRTPGATPRLPTLRFRNPRTPPRRNLQHPQPTYAQ